MPNALIRNGAGLVRNGAMLTDGACCYRQAKRCSDDALLDLWAKESESTAGAVFKTAGGVCFYWGSVLSLCPGTLANLGTLTSYATCAVCAPGVPCEACTDAGTVTPARYDLIFADVELEIDCFDPNVPTWNVFNQPSLNATIRVTQWSVCEWRADAVTGHRVMGQHAPGQDSGVCTSGEYQAGPDPEFNTFHATLQIGGSPLTASVSLSMNSSSKFVSAFSAAAIPLTNCLTTGSGPNDTTAYTGFFSGNNTFLWLGKNGTVTIVPV